MSNYARCGCEDGYDCTKTTLCHVQTVVEDHESEIWHLTEQLGNMAEEIERLRERCYPDAVVMIDGAGHYVNEIVKAEIERLRKRNALLEDVAVAAENKREAKKKFNKGMMCRDEYHTVCDILDIELDKLREAQR